MTYEEYHELYELLGRAIDDVSAEEKMRDESEHETADWYVLMGAQRIAFAAFHERKFGDQARHSVKA